jgi:hypothetical protein
MALSKFSGIKIFYFLPSAIAVIHVLLFAYADKYPCDHRALNDQGLLLRVVINLVTHGEFSGSVNNAKVFCLTRPPLYSLLMAFAWKATQSTHVVFAKSLVTFLLSLTIWLTVQPENGPIFSHLMLIGFILGLLTLQQPTFLYIPLLFVGYFACLFYQEGAEKTFANFTLIVLRSVITLEPWGLYKQSKNIHAHYSHSYAVGSRHGILSSTTGYFTPAITRLLSLSFMTYCEAWFGIRLLLTPLSCRTVL